MDWNEGYVTDIVYTYGYYVDLNPVRIPFLFSLAGITPPEISTACELGYGQGVSLNIHAASEPIVWYGTDFNPAQAEMAREMAQASGANVHCFADSFRDFCERPDLPDFDYIALHGIWSWISPENQAEIVHLIGKKLRVGGILYISYNAFPGWAPMVPARDLMKYYADNVCKGSSIYDRVGNSLEFMEKLLSLNPRYATEAPNIGNRLATIKKQSRDYVAHEFFNAIWSPDTFGSMAKRLGEARMSFACSAFATEALGSYGFSKEQAEFVKGIEDPTLKQMVCDYLRSTQFRKDFWIKGAVPLGRRARAEILMNQSVILLQPDVTNEIKSAWGAATIAPKIFDSIMPILRDLKPHTIAELENSSSEINLGSLLSPISIMLDSGIMAVTQKKADIAKSRAGADKLNEFYEKKSLEKKLVSFLASPATGGGVPVDRFEQMFIFAMRRGKKNAAELARFSWSILLENGERMLKEGKVLEKEEEAMPELLSRATTFLEKRFPVLRALQVI